MRKKIILLIIIGGVVGVSLYETNKINLLSEQNESLNQTITSLSKTIDNKDLEITSLQISNSELSNTIDNYAKSLIILTQDDLDLIEPLKQYDKQEYLRLYKQIMSDSQDQPETIYDVTTDSEFDMLCRVVEAEIGIGNFDQKCNVASSIINRYYSEIYPNSWIDLLTQRIQFTSVLNGSYKKAEVTQDTIEAIEYAFSIGSTVDDAMYFYSGESSNWHDSDEDLEFVCWDGEHSFYKLKED